MKTTLFFALGLLAFLIVPAAAHAGEPRLIGTSDDWSAYLFIENGNKVCYIASKPENAEGDYSKRGEVFAMVTHRPAENSKNVFSYITGYDFKAGSDASVDIDGQEFVLFTKDDTAWAPDAETDKLLTDAIRKGSKMTVHGTSSRGTKTTDIYSLKGSGGAYDKINKECGA